ncbi:hypothetical protein [[Mycobacterium] fortunisiensis]|nr:hypothetical protein [[Mycobacterium] fortunisiensis]
MYDGTSHVAVGMKGIAVQPGSVDPVGHDLPTGRLAGAGSVVVA